MCAPAEGAGENLQDQRKAIKYFSQKLGKMGAMKILIGKYRNSKVRHQEKEKKRGKGKQKQDKKKKQPNLLRTKSKSGLFHSPNSITSLLAT